MNNKLIAAVSILTIALILQIALGWIFDIKINFSLATLIASSFFLSFLELVFLVFFAAFFLNWQPALSLDIAVFALIPLAAHFIRDMFPWQPWVSNLIFIVAGTILSYIIFGISVLTVVPEVFARDILGSVIFGLFAFRLLNFMFSQQEYPRFGGG